MACWILLAIKFIWQAKYLLKDTLTKISINNSVSLTILSDGPFYDNNFVFLLSDEPGVFGKQCIFLSVKKWKQSNDPNGAIVLLWINDVCSTLL